MSLTHRAAFDRLFCFLVTIFALNLLARAEAPLTGRELFERHWKPNDSLCPDGDGLGPCFNATSCAACHRQGGLGGAGENEHNVDLLTIEESPREIDEITGRRKAPNRWHPSFLKHSSTIILHRFSIYSEYEPYRFSLLGIDYPQDATPTKLSQFWFAQAKKQRKTQPVENIAVDGLHFRLSHRNTPALFGAGLIDAIPIQAIEAIEQEQQPTFGTLSQISGRMAPAHAWASDLFAAPQPASFGRFGWRGQVATLADFVLEACANEIGLQTRDRQQAINPLASSEPKNGIDINDENCQKLIQFVRDLRRPHQIKPREATALRAVDRGAELFRSIGCAICHVENVASVDGLYSDLLLHDMGPELADPVPAASRQAFAGLQGLGNQGLGNQDTMFSGYVGILRSVGVLADVPAENQQEWRTPPLWGVADSAPYLHDGRAPTLHEAIALHGGEAAAVKQRYELLTGSEKANLISFLKTLRAP